MYIVYTKNGPKLFHTSKKIGTFYGPKAFQPEVNYQIGNWAPTHILLPKKKLHLYWQMQYKEKAFFSSHPTQSRWVEKDVIDPVELQELFLQQGEI